MAETASGSNLDVVEARVIAAVVHGTAETWFHDPGGPAYVDLLAEAFDLVEVRA
ncbi:MAG: hypothetical protein AAGK32_08100 [Actinomycetota bacterium]